MTVTPSARSDNLHAPPAHRPYPAKRSGELVDLEAGFECDGRRRERVRYLVCTVQRERHRCVSPGRGEVKGRPRLVIEAHLRSADVGGIGRAKRHDPSRRARPHRDHVGVIGIEYRNAV